MPRTWWTLWSPPWQTREWIQFKPGQWKMRNWTQVKVKTGSDCTANSGPFPNQYQHIYIYLTLQWAWRNFGGTKSSLGAPGVLHRRCQMTHGSDEIRYQLVVPPKFRSQLLKALHDDVGHMGRERTLSLLRERCFWPGMTRDVADYIANCPRCLRSKHPVNQRAPLVNVTTTQPMELVCIDFLSLERSRGGIENVLVTTAAAQLPEQPQMYIPSSAVHVETRQGNA